MRSSAKVVLPALVLAGGLVVFWLRGSRDTSPADVATPAPTADAAQTAAESVAEPIAEARAESEELAGADQPWGIVAVEPALRARLERVRANTPEIVVARLNPAALTGKASPLMRPGAGEVRLVLPEGGQVTGRVERTTAQGPDAWVSSGSVAGVPGARWRMAVVRGRVSASIDGLPGGEVKVRTVETAAGPLAQLYRVDPKLAGDCIALPMPARPPVGAMAAGLPAEPTVDAVSGVNPAWLTSGDAVIDVLVVYTSAVRAELGSAAAVEAEALVALSNTNDDFSSSDIPAIVRLAGTLEVEMPGDDQPSLVAGWQETALHNMAGVTDGIMDDVHAAREAVGADLVTLVVQRPDSRSSGIAYIMERTGHYSEPFFGFSVVNIAGFSDATTLSHELGHNLGCAHDRENAGTLPDRGYHGAYPGAYGYRVSGTDTHGTWRQIRTIMAYSPGVRLRYFSNPELHLSSFTQGAERVDFAQPLVMGVAVADDPEHAADNASVLRRSVFQVAGYRLAPDRGFTGRLVNVSTRAYVGSGYKTLTGGFVVSGDEPKRVLVRAPGPTIGQPPYNVPGVLADTVLRLHRIGDGVVAENDDWELPAANGAAVAAAGEMVGAFAFGNGNRDSALVADLAPGSYSAEVTGAGGAEGLALVEAYDVSGDAAESRLLNLSTRAYATTEDPIVAGFVVRGQPGAEAERKTMFLRVRGPSLANYGLPADEVMPDPTIEIYDDEARLVYVNDDWDAPPAIIDPFIPELKRGEVDRPSEEAVFAAAAAVGATDMLPVEPGVVIELPAGLYTMFVRPFTNDADPVGEPGVAIVEVFELTH